MFLKLARQLVQNTSLAYWQGCYWPYAWRKLTTNPSLHQLKLPQRSRPPNRQPVPQRIPAEQERQPVMDQPPQALMAVVSPRPASRQERRLEPGRAQAPELGRHREQAAAQALVPPAQGPEGQTARRRAAARFAARLVATRFGCALMEDRATCTSQIEGWTFIMT